MTLYSPAQLRKAIGTAIVGVYAWAQFVVNSTPAHITANEWLLLGGVGVTVAAVFGLTNDPAPVPEPELPAEKAGTTFLKEFDVDVPGIPNAKFVGDAGQVVPPPVA